MMDLATLRYVNRQAERRSVANKSQPVCAARLEDRAMTLADLIQRLNQIGRQHPEYLSKEVAGFERPLPGKKNPWHFQVSMPVIINERVALELLAKDKDVRDA